MKSSMFLTLALCATTAACSDDDSQQPTTGTFTVRIENVAPWTVLKSAAQTVKTTGVAGPAGPGEAYDISFTAGKGQAVSFATMLGESNDWFFAPGSAGIALYDPAGTPISGDVTAQVGLWNAGTEVDQEPAVGPDTGPHQATPDQGLPDSDPTVRPIGSTIVLADGSTFMVPPIAAMISATVKYHGDQLFTLHIENVSTAATMHTTLGDIPIHVSPVFWALHMIASPNALFTPGTVDRGQGLEQIAESGNTAPLAAAIPGSVVASIPVGATTAGPAVPGQAYEFTITAQQGDRLSFATMFGTSNDWFFGTPPDGVPLFDGDGQPVSGDVTDMISLYDAGTEIDEEPAIGPDTGPQQLSPDQGQVDPVNQVREVPTAEYGRPASAHVRVTLTPM